MIITLESCKDLTDRELVAMSLENLDFFSCLYQRYEPDMLRYIYRLTAVGEDEARDILQEAFIKIWRKLNEFETDLKFASWVYRIVHNESISYYRKKRSYGKDRTLEVERYSETLVDEEVEIDTEERLAMTRAILESLPMKYREVLVLRYYEKMSYDEISDILKIPEGTVAIRINRAKKLFREKSMENRINT